MNAEAVAVANQKQAAYVARRVVVRAANGFDSLPCPTCGKEGRSRNQCKICVRDKGAIDVTVLTQHQPLPP